MSVYRHQIPKVGGVLVLTAAFVIGLAARADAAHILRLTAGANSLTLLDDGACVAVGVASCFVPVDVVPGQGGMSLLGSVGTFALNVTTGVSKPVLGSASRPFMDLGSLNVSSGAAGALVIEQTDTDFTSAPGLAMAIGGTTTGSVITYSAYFDTANTPFGQGGHIGTLGPFIGAFSGTLSGFGPPSGLFSLTQLVRIDDRGAGVTSFNALLVPEPATVALFGMGLAAVGVAMRRRRQALRA